MRFTVSLGVSLMANNFKFTDNSKQVKKQMSQAGEAGMEAALLLIEASAKAKSPVDTGELRDKIDHKTESQGKELVGKVGSPLDYSIYVEFGTGEFSENANGRKGGWSYKSPDGKWHHTIGMSPQPFLRPAFRENKAKIRDIIGKEYGATFKGK